MRRTTHTVALFVVVKQNSFLLKPRSYSQTLLTKEWETVETQFSSALSHQHNRLMVPDLSKVQENSGLSLWRWLKSPHQHRDRLWRNPLTTPKSIAENKVRRGYLDNRALLLFPRYPVTHGASHLTAALLL
jgi:hypothetical protein